MHSAFPRRWRFLFAVIVSLVVLTTSIPIINWLQRPDGSTYTGYSYESVGDIFVYLNLIEQAKNGELLLKDFFTPEEHGGILLNPLYLILGWTARLFHLTPLVAWHLFRVLFLFAFVLLLYRVLAGVTRNERERRVVLLAILTTGSLLLLSHEASTFLSLLYSPMAGLTLLLSLGYFHLFLDAAEKGLTAWRFFGMFLLGAAQSTSHPYVVVLWAAIPLVFIFLGALIRERPLRASIILALPPISIAAFYLAFYFFTVFRSPILRSWAENAMLGPWPPSVLFLFLGALGLLAIVGIVACRNELWKNQRGRFFLVWLIVGIFISQIPGFPYAYRVMAVMHLPLAYMASMGIVWLWQKSRKHLRLQMLLVFLAVPAFSDNISHLTHNFRRDYRASQKLYLTSETSQAMLWLRKETPTNSVLLHSPGWDTLLAEQAYRQVYATAGWQTVDSTRNIFSALYVYSGKE
ncbi:MAG: hypothetical protein HY566_02360 [Candidatus Kerfeldbacteria bacterium]|nr:hypothetical protein [Candidatus Kerfeldbacteria bacterium]